ncbi:MAG: hypothetical protein WA160_06315 [Pseudobdellovibrio sp.]
MKFITRMLLLAFAVLPLSFFFNNCSKLRSSAEINQFADLASTNDTSNDIPFSPTPQPSQITPIALKLVDANPDWPLDTNCATNNTYDTCLIWKNPVAHRFMISSNASASIFYNTAGSPWPFKKGQDLTSITTLAVNIKKYQTTAGGPLKNNFIDVFASNGAADSNSYLRTSAVNGKYKFQHHLDPNFNYTQVMAFYWINYAKEYFEKNGAIYHSSKTLYGKPAIPVDAFKKTIINNANFSWGTAKWGTVNLGLVAKDNVNFDHELALSADVYIHEMGHANLYYALGGPDNQSVMSDTNLKVVNNNKFCISEAGCFTAINEGQADFHSHVLFKSAPTLLETFLNTATGSNDRNANFIKNYTLLQWYNLPSNIFSSVKGEVHALGSFYGSVLFDIYSHPDTDKVKFLKVFTAHLQLLSGSSTFTSVKQDLLTADNAIAGKSHASIINQIFTARGL